MKSKSKTLLIVLSAVLLVTASVLGTLAYLTDTTEVKNTFTVGKVDIKLDEAEVGADGKALTSGARIPSGDLKGNAYHLIPGGTYDKDPTVTVLKGSEKCYVRMLVTINCQDAIDDIAALRGKMMEVFTGYKNPTTENGKWRLVDGNPDIDIDDDSRTYEFRYITIVSAVPATGMDLELDPLFTGIKVPDGITNENLKSLAGDTTHDALEIKIVAQAIQADGFVGDDTTTAEDAAWAAFGTP